MIIPKDKPILVIGRAGMDFYPDPPGTRTEDAEKFVSHLGGSSANICVGISQHGGKTALVTRVSDDAIGRFCLNQLAHYKIDARYVRNEGGEARNSLAVVESRVEDHQSVIYRNGAADFEMSIEDIDAIDFEEFGAVITTGTVFAAEPSRTAAFHAFDKAKAANLPVIFDVDYRPYSWPSAKVASDVYSRAAGYCDVVIGNDDEFGFMVGDKSRGLNKARELAQTGAAIVVYKMGENGAVTFYDGHELKTGIYEVSALKPTGAGDAFMGSFIAALMDNMSVEQAVLRGSAAAAIVVSKVGCAPAMPTTEQLEDFIAAHSGPSDPQFSDSQ